MKSKIHIFATKVANSFHAHTQIACLMFCMCMLLTSCSAPRPIGIGNSFSPSCQLVTALSSSNEEITIGVDPDVLSGISSVSEIEPAILSIRSTLTVLDCESKLQPGAAVKWEKANEGRAWRFQLHKDLYPIDTTSLSVNALTARTLARHWEQNIIRFDALEKIEAVSEYEIVFHLKEAQDSFPLFLISPYFSLAIKDATHPGVVNRIDANADVRDMLEDDSGMAGVITKDPDVIEYASSKSDWVTQPLPWDRTYVLVTKSHVLSDIDRVPTFPQGISSSFVHDVVKSEAQVFQAPAWWEQTAACSISFDTRESVVLNPFDIKQNILYPAGDVTAKALSERLAALASGAISVAGSDSLSAIVPGMGSTSYDWSAVSIPSESGFNGVYIVSLPKQVFDPCLAMENLKSTMPWLFDQVSGRPYTFIPLVDTRPALIVRKGVANFDMDGFGRLYVSHPEVEGQP